MIRIPVRTPSRSYQVLLGSGLLARAGEHLGKLVGRRRVFVITVPPVRRRWGKVLLQSLAEAGVQAVTLEMADGERFKRLATLEKLAESLVKLGADRSATLIALGGGVVCDVTGFLASVYMRGVEVIQIPTTVLAQVDAAIGGKTGVNLQSGKNLLGTFHQPRVVLIDPNVLTTLPSRVNLGHTIGHALEAETRYTQLLHGEAVAWGMIAATRIALSTGKLDTVTAARIRAAILGFGRLPRMKFQTTGVLKRLRSDKKTRQGAVHFVLPSQIGKVQIVSDVPAAAVRSAVEEIRKLSLK